jgi:hypothetical protein
MNQLVITPRTVAELHILKKMLAQIGTVKELEVKKKRNGKRKLNSPPFATISESSLAKEWLSEEDNVWDEWYGKRKKRSKFCFLFCLRSNGARIVVQ